MPVTPSPPPSITELPPAPNSVTDSFTEFDIKANNTVAAQVTMVPQINTANTWTESTAQEVYDNALEAEESAVNSQSSADDAEESAIIAQNAARLLGNWDSLTGAVDIGETVVHEDAKWQARVSISDVTLSEPTLSNREWLLINASGKTTPIADGETLNANVINSISLGQSNPLPLAASVPNNTRLRISVSEEYSGIRTTHLVSGTDTTTDSKGTSDGFIFNWPVGGTIHITSDGLNNWRF